MCGRIAQSRAVADYLETIAWNTYSLPDALGLQYNIPPGTRPLALHRLDNHPAVTRLFWGYKPAWFKRAPVSNARLDTILDPSKSFWRTPFQYGRMLVPADGWYEWTGEKGSKQPWFIHACDNEPLMIAAVCAWRPGAPADAAHGMALVTDAAAGGMIDIHDRRPVVLAPDLACEWADPATTSKRAIEIMANAQPPDAFRWHAVRREVSHSSYQNADAISPMNR